MSFSSQAGEDNPLLPAHATKQGENLSAQHVDRGILPYFKAKCCRFSGILYTASGLTMLGLFTVFGLSLVFSNHCGLVFGLESAVVTGNSQASTSKNFLPKDIFGLSWAQYSPWFPAASYQPPPRNCKVTQVNLIERHGARFPTSSAGKRIQATVTKLKAAVEHTGPLAFVANFTYDLGADNLLPFGAYQASQSAARLASRYPRLVSSKNPPFVRASSSQRVVDTATNWTQGWFMASGIHTPLSLILSESANDTLDDSMCPNAGDSDEQTEAWINTFGPPIAARLNNQAPGANLTADDVYNLLSLCPFETLAKEQRSSFCDVFTQDEFNSFEYTGDLDKYYNTGYGQPLGRVQGVGYVNELLARLTGTPVRDNTQTNRTLDSSPVTFPLNRTIYADFSHDNQMIAIYAAMGLFPQASAPDPTKPNSKRNWRANLLVPFSAKMITEKVTCSSGGGGGDAKEFVRVLVNDALQPLNFCGAGKDGLCELRAFVESQAYARNDGEGDFEKCFS